MLKVKILLVDDEEDALNLMESLLGSNQHVMVVGKALTRANAISKMIDLQPDVIFQDIQMHGTNGLDLVDEYRSHLFKGKIVFVTAHAEYAIEAIKKMAFDYLLKPVDIEDLNALVLRILSAQNGLNTSKNNHTRKLKIPTRQGYSLIHVNDILYCEADGNYTYVCSINNGSATTSINLGKIEKELSDARFFRISRSILINIDYLTSINKGDKMCHLRNYKQEHDFHISSKRIKALEMLL